MKDIEMEINDKRAMLKMLNQKKDTKTINELRKEIKKLQNMKRSEK